MTNCRFCGDREGGCVACYGEIEKKEREKAVLIENWQPPSELLDALKNGKLPDGDFSGIDRLSFIIIMSKVDSMEKSVADAFINSLQTPPPEFTAQVGNESDMEILKRYFSAKVMAGDGAMRLESRRERGIAARTQQKMKQQAAIQHITFYDGRKIR